MNRATLRDLKSIYLIVGTAIGAGILALPISTAQSGFSLSCLELVVCWLFMTIAAFFLIEARLYFKKECDMDHMSEQLVGPKFEIFTKITYLLLLFSLMAAYISVGSSWITELLNFTFKVNVNPSISMTIFTLLSATIITQGIHLVGKANHVITVILLISFALIIMLSLNHVKYDNLTHMGGLTSISRTLPLILTSFGFSIIIPSIASYQSNSARRMKKSVLIGSLMILFAYLVWQLIAFGIIGTTLQSFITDKNQGTLIILALENTVQNAMLSQAARNFVIFAVISSLLGVGMSLYHFMRDAIKMKKAILKIPTSILLTFIPPLTLLIFYPTGIVQILNFAGIFVALILGIIPCVMVWYGRYIKNIKANYHVAGGKSLILLTTGFFLYVIIQEIFNLYY